MLKRDEEGSRAGTVARARATDGLYMRKIHTILLLLAQAARYGKLRRKGQLRLHFNKIHIEECEDNWPQIHLFRSQIERMRAGGNEDELV